MNVQINTTKAAQSFKSFIKAHGGDAQHSEILEMLAGVCGFDSYRAMAATPVSRSEVALVVPANAPASQKDFSLRNLEDESRVVFRSSAVDWQLADMPDISLGDLPAAHRTKYDVVLEGCGDQFRLLLKPEGTNLDNFDGRPVLDMLIEINEGVPCVHMTNDPNDAMLLTVFATGKGLLVRPDDGEWARARNVSLPAELKEVYKASCDIGFDKENAFVVLLDTAAKYADCKNEVVEQAPAAPPSQEVAANLPTSYPRFATDLVNPVDNAYFGARVEVSFDPKIDVLGQNLYLDIDILDGQGSRDDGHFGTMLMDTLLPSNIDNIVRFGKATSQVAAWLLEQDFSLDVVGNIVENLVQHPAPVAAAETCLAEVYFSADVKTVFNNILKSSLLH